MNQLTTDNPNEKILSRLYTETKKYDYGIITAISQRHPYTAVEHKQRSKSLMAKLKLAGFKVTGIQGSCHGIEGNIFFVNDVQKKKITLDTVLLKLAQEFEQDLVVFGRGGEQAVVMGVLQESVSATVEIFTEHGLLVTEIGGSPFVFTQPLELVEYGCAYYPSEIRGPYYISQKHWSELNV